MFVWLLRLKGYDQLDLCDSLANQIFEIRQLLHRLTATLRCRVAPSPMQISANSWEAGIDLAQVLRA